MASGLRIDPASATPLWGQIEAQLRQLIGSRRLEPGAPLPSVRALATELVINPATVARAYARLCDDGLLVVRRGEGTFVADAPPELSSAARRKALRDAAEAYVATGHALGASAAEVVEAVDAVLARARRRTGEDRR